LESILAKSDRQVEQKDRQYDWVVTKNQRFPLAKAGMQLPLGTFEVHLR
jgi:hypothetical protein